MGLTEKQKEEWQKDYQKQEAEGKKEDKKHRRQQRVGVIGLLTFMYAKADPLFAPGWITVIAWGICSICVLYLFILFIISMWKGE